MKCKNDVRSWVLNISADRSRRPAREVRGSGKKSLKNQASKVSADISVYRRIESDLRDKIRNGQWSAGSLLPSQRDLAQEYRVSPGTVRRAVERLLSDGTLLTEDRRGTFVARRLPPQTQSGEEASTTPVAQWVPPPPRPPRQGLETVGIIGASFTDWSGLKSQDSVIVRAIEHAFADIGVMTTLYNRYTGEGVLTPLADVIEAALQARDDALIIICMNADRLHVEEALRPLDLHDVPAVCILAGELHLPIPHIFYDNRMAGFQAAKHLTGKGHRDISVVAPTRASWVTERIDGVRKAIAHANLPPDSLRVLSGDARLWSPNEDPVNLGYGAVKAALAEGWSIAGGIIGISDDVAKGLIAAAAEQGLQPGVDFAVMGFDDHPYDRTIGLTTMRPPLEDMGREAARLLLDDPHSMRRSFQIRLCAHLIPRASTRYPPTGRGANAV